MFFKLKQHFTNLVLSTIVIPENASLIYPDDQKNVNNHETTEHDENTKTIIFDMRQVALPIDASIDNYNFLYVGDDLHSPGLNALQMKFSDKVFYCIDNKGEIIAASNAVKSVMNRSGKIEQIRNAQIIGILETLVKDHRDIVKRLKKLIRSSGKKSYNFFLGKINEAKLANLNSVDVFVYVACSQSSIFQRKNNDYIYKKVVSPWEIEVALNPNFEWSLKFETNFRELLKLEEGSAEHESSPDDYEDEK